MANARRYQKLFVPTLTELRNHPEVREVTPTGSRYICEPPVMDTDMDIVVLVYEFGKGVNALIQDLGYDFDPNAQAGDYELDMLSPSGFMSLRKDDVNLIVTSDNGFFAKFRIATVKAKAANILDKEERKALFQRVLYANKDYQIRDARSEEETPF